MRARRIFHLAYAKRRLHTSLYLLVRQKTRLLKYPERFVQILVGFGLAQSHGLGDKTRKHIIDSLLANPFLLGLSQRCGAARCSLATLNSLSHPREAGQRSE